jgi:uncharacterized protein (DUF1800 family)
MDHLNHIDPRKRLSKKTISNFRKVAPIIFKTDPKSPFNGTRTTLNTCLVEYTGEWTNSQVAHLLKRTLFGVKKDDLNYFKNLTMNEAVDELLTATNFSPPINDYEFPGSGIEDPDVEVGETWVEAPYNNAIEGYRIQSLKGWIISNILDQERSIHQKLTLFWHNLLVTQFWSVFVAKGSYKYYQMLYDNAFGNYKELIKLLTLDPAMLFFLNGNANNKEAPDENYARELQELFCIGKGPNAGFTEGDVQAAARVLTGWVIKDTGFDTSGPLDTRFYAGFHDTNDKQFSAFYGNRVIEGRTGGLGTLETDELLDMIFDNEETALYICRRIYIFFVYHEIDEATETNVIIPLANIFRTGNYEILPVLQALFKSEHFFDVANYGAVIKNPADHLLGMWRTFGINRSQLLDYEKFYLNTSLLWSMSEVGMEIGDPPSVAGWQAYYQEPSFDRFWINTDTITKRAIRQDSLIFPGWGHWVTNNLQINADLLAFIEGLDNPSDPNELIAETNMLFHGIELSQEIKDGFKNILLSGQVDDFYWTDAWNLYLADKKNSENRLIIENRLVAFFQPFLQLAEFQLM